ncbi:MAG TPA: ABC transporter permease [Thermoleophilaceae bacterium]|nr:ABC transporter permease [Thermoleophilaceae bacterium]
MAADETVTARRLRRTRTVDRVARTAGVAIATTALVAMLAPVLLTVLVSFSGDDFFAFPPESWGLRQYRELLESPLWGAALQLSFEVAAAVAALSVAIGVPAAYAIQRSRLPGRHALYAAGLTGMVIPIAAFAVALYGLLSQLGLRGTFVGLVLANATLAVPVVLIVITAALSRVPPTLELVAMTAGASRLRASLGITVRLLAPAIVASTGLAFVTSFEEAVLVNFVGGVEQTTLPRAILDSARFGTSPVITAIATLMMAGIGLVAIGSVRLLGRRR